MSLKDKYDRAEQLTDDTLQRVKDSRFSVVIVALIALVVIALILL